MFPIIRNIVTAICFFYISLANAQYQRMFVLGDSLSDIGTLEDTKQVPYLSDSPYQGGRFSNGPVAVELLATSLGLELNPSLHLTGKFTGTNFAVAGATAGGQDPIDLGTQLNAMLAVNPTGFSAQDIFIVFFGGNDIRRTSTLSNRDAYRVLFDAVTQIESAINALIASGAENIVVVNAPDIGKIPESQLLSAGDATLPRKLTQRSRVFNLFLNKAVGRLKNRNDTQIVKFNLFSFFKYLKRNGEDLGYQNAQGACFLQQQLPPFEQFFNPNCDFDKFLFFDAIHPTAVTHARAAKALEAIIPVPDTDQAE